MPAASSQPDGSPPTQKNTRANIAGGKRKREEIGNSTSIETSGDDQETGGHTEQLQHLFKDVIHILQRQVADMVKHGLRMLLANPAEKPRYYPFDPQPRDPFILHRISRCQTNEAAPILGIKVYREPRSVGCIQVYRRSLQGSGHCDFISDRRDTFQGYWQRSQ